MGALEVDQLSYALPGGRVLFSDVSFKVPQGAHVALVGVNGVGKTTLLRILAGELEPGGGSVRRGGRVAFMRQFVARDASTTLRSFLLEHAPEQVRSAAAAVVEAERSLASGGDPLAYAEALQRWGDA
ncbi:MAG TPA: ATP-binding cassette domain-containing protein, partial [Actinomycetota bacterium]|nr:ATP-binding cassette domain-containing protein [Actinomycetota bacterium]